MPGSPATPRAGHAWTLLMFRRRRHAGPLGLGLAGHERGERLERVDALVADELDLLGDRHLHADAVRQVTDRQAALDPFGGLPGRGLRLLQGLAAAEVLAERAVARQRRGAGGHQVAEAGEAG